MGPALERPLVLAGDRLLELCAGRPVELGALTPAVLALAMALRAAALRGLERCGRVRGRLARTP